jgi:hypothetical protein
MNTQTQEAARQILGQVSDIQAVVSMCGMPEVNLKLTAIREKAAFLLEDHKTPEQIIEGYAGEASDALIMLGSMITENGHSSAAMADDNLLQLVRVAEVFVQRSRVYFNRKQRHIQEG